MECATCKLLRILFIADKIFTFDEVTSAGYAYAVSCHFLTYSPSYFQLWRPVNDETISSRNVYRLLYSQKIQPIMIDCRTDVS